MMELRCAPVHCAIAHDGEALTFQARIVNRVRATSNVPTGVRPLCDRQGLQEAWVAHPVLTVGSLDTVYRSSHYACGAALTRVLALADNMVYMQTGRTVIARCGERIDYAAPLPDGELLHVHASDGYLYLLMLSGSELTVRDARADCRIVHRAIVNTSDDGAMLQGCIVSRDLIVLQQRSPTQRARAPTQLTLVSLPEPLVHCSLQLVNGGAPTVLHAAVRDGGWIVILWYKDLAMVQVREPSMDVGIALPASTHCLAAVQDRALVYVSSSERGDVYLRSLLSDQVRVWENLAPGALWIAVDGPNVRLRTRTGYVHLQVDWVPG